MNVTTSLLLIEGSYTIDSGGAGGRGARASNRVERAAPSPDPKSKLFPDLSPKTTAPVLLIDGRWTSSRSRIGADVHHGFYGSPVSQSRSHVLKPQPPLTEKATTPESLIEMTSVFGTGELGVDR